MSARDEILAALTENPAGLTLKELAPLCPAGDCDEQVVGRNIATLRSEGEIHPDGFRLGANVWKLGKRPGEEERERHLSLAGAEQRRPSTPRQAAHAIASERAATRQAPPAEPKPAERVVRVSTLAILTRMTDAARANGSCTIEAFRKLLPDVSEQDVRTYCRDLVQQEVLERVPGRGTERYRLKAKNGEAAPAPKPELTIPKFADAALPAKVEDAHFAINEEGELGIEKNGTTVSLTLPELQRLQLFLGRARPILESAAA